MNFVKTIAFGQSTFYQKKKQLGVDVDIKDIQTSRFQCIVIKSQEVPINLNGNTEKGDIEVIRLLLQVRS